MSKQTERAADAAIQTILDRCAADPCYWLFNRHGWVKTKDEHDRTTPLKPFSRASYLQATLRIWNDDKHKLLYVAKSRQLMISWLLSAYALWTLKFRPYSTVLFQSKKLDDAVPMIYQKAPQMARASLMEYNLPDWMKVVRMPDGSYEPFDVEAGGSMGHIVAPNGSQIVALAQGAAQVESKVPTLFLNDEASLQDEWASAQAAAQPAIDGDARGITVGTMRLPSDYGEAISPSWDVDPDSLQRGMSEFRTPEGVYGLRIHYTADPDKDPETPIGAAWKRGQLETGAYMGGEKGWRWQQHMEINPQSRAGQVVLPKFRDGEDRIVIAPKRFGAMWNWSFDSGLDWGVRNQAVWLVFGMDPHGYRYLCHEISVPGGEIGGIPGLCQLIRAHPLFDKCNGTIASDPSLWNRDQNMAGGLVDKATIFRENGVDLVPARQKGQDADEVLADRLNYHYWAGCGTQGFDPLLKIFDHCVETIRRLPELMYEDHSEAIASQKSKKETIRDLHTDEWDAMKYAESMWPEGPTYRAPLHPGSFAWRERSYRRKVIYDLADQGSGDIFDGSGEE